jgi:uncharacterized protein involved in exopolysaccharide biosynthesis
MLNRLAWRSTRTGDPQAPNPELIDLAEAFRVLRRRRLSIAGTLVLAISGALVYLAMTPPRYTASSMLLFDIRKVEPFQQQGSTNVAADSAFVDSQAEVLKSDNIARSVITKLKLLSDPEFAQQEGGLIATIQKLVQHGFHAILGADGISVGADSVKIAACCPPLSQKSDH